MVGKRFGGTHSPGGPTAGAPRPRLSQWDTPPPRRGSKGAVLLYVASVPLFVAGLGEVLQGDPLGIVTELGAFALTLSGAWLVHEGVKAEHAFEARTVAKAPALPRKLLGALAVGAGVAVAAAFGWSIGLVGGVALGAIAATAGVLAFGPDPMKSKGLDAHSTFDRERVATAVDKAEGLLDELLQAARQTRDREITTRVEGLAAAVRAVIEQVQKDPRDLPRVRKYLGLYLTGARDATVKFADIWTRSQDPEARIAYTSVIDDLEQSFLARREALLLDDRTDLDIEIDVLRHRLQQDGLSAPVSEE